MSARLKDRKQRITLARAQTKLFAAEAFLLSSLDAAHIYGASGLLEGSQQLEQVQDALANWLFAGSSEIQKNIIAALLGTGDGINKSVIPRNPRGIEDVILRTATFSALNRIHLSGSSVFLKHFHNFA